jgi:wyosine [tRNA(Phe)-imidazoG37] synthetase (radical SAM superfamily)
MNLTNGLNNLKTNKIMKQTAVEFLVIQLHGKQQGVNNSSYNSIIEQAKKMEKQQIINFVNWCNSEDAEDLILDLILIGELNKKPTTKELLEIYKKEKGL